MRIFRNSRNPFSFLFAGSRHEEHLVRYVLREHEKGRSVKDVFDDAYVRNRSTADERARLLERPEVVSAIGERAVADLRISLANRAA